VGSPTHLVMLILLTACSVSPAVRSLMRITCHLTQRPASPLNFKNAFLSVRRGAVVGKPGG
jgi:hypothetical protein